MKTRTRILNIPWAAAAVAALASTPAHAGGVGQATIPSSEASESSEFYLIQTQ